MAAATLPDWISSSSFTEYTDLATKESSKLISSGAMETDSELSDFLATSGDTITARFAVDLTGDSEVSDDSNDNATPAALLGPGQKVARLVRNKSFAYKSVIAEKSHPDPAASAAGKFGGYWGREADKIAVQALVGVFADNAAAPAGSEHVQNDMTYDAKGASFSSGVTDFNIFNLETARAKMGDALKDLVLILVHPVVYAKMTDAMLTSLANRGITMDLSDELPYSGTVYESWLFARGAIKYAIADAQEFPFEISRNAATGKGGGETAIYSRKNLAIAPAGASYIGSTASGQPTNATLASAASWQRVYPERKHIGIGRLITREA